MSQRTMDAKVHSTEQTPIMTDIDWNENGKIVLSFHFYPHHKNRIEIFELYYCYIPDDNDNWYKYASNNWRSICISSHNTDNKNIDLRIATCPDIYDENKNKNIELLLKMRCHLKSIDWIHSHWTEFSSIYYVKSISIPSILNRQTPIETILDCIFNDNNDNNNKQTAKQQLSSLFASFKTMSDVNKSFIRLIAQHIRKYYQYKSHQILYKQQLHLTFSFYLLEIEKFINYEQKQLFPYIDEYCDTMDKQTIMNAMINTLFDDTNDKIRELIYNADSKAHDLMINMFCNQNVDLSKLYLLYVNVHGNCTKIADIFKRYLLNLTEQKQNIDISEHELMKNLINLHDKFFNIIQLQFKQNPIFDHILKERFEEFMNVDCHRSTILATFTNNILQKGSKYQISDLQNILNHIVILYGYINDKDIFEKIYQRYFAQRLLKNVSISEQTEKLMIEKFKTKCCYHWTLRLEEMLKDMQRSKELMKYFEEKYNKFAFKLNVNVCTNGKWPIDSIDGVQKPSEIVEICDKFKRFYTNKYNQRTLRFQLKKGSAELSVQFNAKTNKILVVSTYQMIVLLLFNDKIIWTFKEILETTKIPKQDLIIAILSMCHPKIQIIKKYPNIASIDDYHQFEMNINYKNPQKQITVPIMINCYDEKMYASVNKLRKYEIDATIIRIMKHNKTLNHIDLVNEVINQLRERFKVKSVDIKIRIGILIDMEYIKRDENNREIYHYRSCFKSVSYKSQTTKPELMELYDCSKNDGTNCMFIYVGCCFNDIIGYVLNEVDRYKRYHVKINVNCTVEQLKYGIQDIKGIPPEQQRLIFKGRVLNNNDILTEKGVQPGMTINTILLLRGS